MEDKVERTKTVQAHLCVYLFSQLQHFALMYEGQRTLALSHEPNRIIEMVENHLHCHTEETLFFDCSASLKKNGMTERLSKHPSSFCFKKDIKLNQIKG